MVLSTNKSNPVKGKIEGPDCLNLEMFKLNHRILTANPSLHFYLGEGKIQDHFSVPDT